MRLLFVCTGNRCRSPIAEGLTAAWVQRALGSEAGHVSLLSAGTVARPGEPMDRNSAAALSRLGGDPSQLRSRPLLPELATGADLVLTMTRKHRRAVLEMAPRGLRTTFTLLEAADLLRGVEARDLVRLPLDERARTLGRRLDAGRARRPSTDADDIDDPIGRRAAVHSEVADTIAEALRPLLSVLFPTPVRSTAPPLPGGLPVRV